MYPVTYSYNSRNITRRRQENCDWLKHSIGNFVFRRCTHPNVLTDSVIDMSNRSTDRYNTNNGLDGQFLFTFSSQVTLTHITLYYDNDGRYGLPTVTFLAVVDHFELWNETRGTIIASVSGIPRGQGQQGLRNINSEITVNVITKKMLMYIPYNGYRLSLREMEFFGNTGKIPIDKTQSLQNKDLINVCMYNITILLHLQLIV